MKEVAKRSLLRWVHIVFGLVPILGYIYSPIDKVSDYAPPTRYIFVPILLLTGYWMYSGGLFAIVAVALWLGAVRFSGYGAALLSQIALIVVWKIWLATRARSNKSSITPAAS